MIFIGIDPGAKGAVAVIPNADAPGAPIIQSWDKDREDNYAELLKSVATLADNTKDKIVCCLERVGAMPGQGVTSMFNFGKNFGYIIGLLTAYNIPYELVSPQKWKKEFGVTSDKNTAIAVAQRLYPTVELKRTQRCKKPDDGRAEAVLMAVYMQRKYAQKRSRKTKTKGQRDC